MANNLNLAPKLVRQRCVIELITQEQPSEEFLKTYLVELSRVSKMTPMGDPTLYPINETGFGGWIFWTTSGAHIYSYPPHIAKTEGYFVTIDSYTCKAYDLHEITLFTAKYFKATDIQSKEVYI